MCKLNIFFVILFSIIFTSCYKGKNITSNSTKDSNEINSSEVKPKFEPEKSFNLDLYEYKVYGNIQPSYELGYDDNYHAYLTDLRTFQQVFFLCSSYEPDYMKEDFLQHYDDAIKENRDLKDILAIVIEWCKELSIKQETVWDEHFQSEITRYYVPYTFAYKFFHI